MIIALFFNILWLSLVKSQSSLQWGIPQEIQSSSITIFVSQNFGIKSKTSKILFKDSFSEVPAIMLSLTRFQEIIGDAMFYQIAENITKTQFTQKIIANDDGNNLKIITGHFLAINLNIYNFMFPFMTYVQPEYLANSNDPSSQFIETQFLNDLDSSHTFSIQAFLTGFSIKCTAGCQIGVSAQLYTDTSYLLKLASRYGYLIMLQYTRVLIDRTEQSSNAVGKGQLEIDMGSISHYVDFQSQFSSGYQDFYEEAFFFGIKQFSIFFDLSKYDSIFYSLNQRQDISIFYLTIKQKQCHHSQPFYSPSELQCFQNCQIAHYQLSLQECGVCASGCYKCTGPLPDNCTQCPQIFNRQFDLATNQCVCKASMIQMGDYRCKLCSDIIYACDTCTNYTHCQTCFEGCSSDGSGGCVCQTSCEPFEFKYVSPHDGTCQCMQQYFLVQDTSSCQPCNIGCYICTGSSDNCLECIDRYHLIDNKCIYFVVSDSLLSKTPSHIFQNQRCISKLGDSCIQDCNNPRMIVQSKCFDSQCPAGKFSIQDPNGNNFCHPCKSPCLSCIVYYICEICSPHYYYLSSTGECLPCIDNCLQCTDATSCLTCQTGYIYQAGNNACELDVDVDSLLGECPEGCLQCVVQQFCEICKNGYFLSEQTYQCQMCTQDTEGVEIKDPYINAGWVLEQCVAKCGDGIILNQQCDDNNNKNNDGCSQNCKIQEGYMCQDLQAYKYSVCYRQNYSLQFSAIKNLTNNQIIISVKGDGIDIGIQALKISCEGNNTFLQSFQTNNKGEVYKNYKFLMVQSMQNQVCQLQIEDSIYFKNDKYIIESSPQALLIQQKDIQQIDGLNIFNIMIEYTYLPVSILLWLIMIVSIDPYEIWAGIYFCVLFLGLLYDYLHSIPNNYFLLKGLEMLTIRYGQYSVDPSTYISQSYKILLLFCVVLVYNQLGARFLKNKLIFPVTQIAIFQRVFEQRFTTYYCAFIAFEPIIYLNSYKLFIQYLSGQTNAIQFSQQQIISLVIILAFGICFIASFVFMILDIKDILNYQPIRQQNMYQYKFAYILCSCRILNILLITSIIYNASYQMLASWGTLSTLLLWIIIVLIDDRPQKIKPPQYLLNTDNAYEESDISQSEASQFINGIRDINIEDQAIECCTIPQARFYLRKFSMLMRMFSLIVVCISRIIYFSDYDYTLSESQNEGQMSNMYYHQQYQILGNISSIGFIIGVYYIPLILGIIIQILIICHFVYSDTDAILKQLRQDNEKNSQTAKKSVFRKTHDQSLNGISQLYISCSSEPKNHN